METYAIVRQEYLNHHGYLFGGAMLSWVDEYTWIAASKDFPGYKIVTRAMDEIRFATPVNSGAILRFSIQLESQKTSSVCYKVEVFADEEGRNEEISVFSTRVVLVAVDENGKKAKLPKKE